MVTACAILTAISTGILLWQWVSGRKFRFLKPFHPDKHPTPPGITIFKPLRGIDAHLEVTIDSFFHLNYPTDRVEILFGVKDASDPALNLVKTLAANHQNIQVQYIICPEQAANNPKVSTLIQLQKHAQNEIYVLSDADVRVPPDILYLVVQELRNPETGLVFCPYAIVGDNSIPAILEKIGTNADFWAQALLAHTIGNKSFAFGALIGFKKTTLGKIGGFERIGNFLADDYYLAKLVHDHGLKVKMLPMPVECFISRQSLKHLWQHQLRWARTIKSVQPINYTLSILANTTFWAVLLGITSQTIQALITAIAIITLRIFVARDLATKLLRYIPSAIYPDHYCKPTGSNATFINLDLVRSELSWKNWFLVPLRDLLAVSIWVTSFLGNTVIWAGQKFKVGPKGVLHPIQTRS